MTASHQRFDEQTLLAEVLKSIENAENPRLRQVMTGFITHLHAFVRDVRPTPDEWMAGIKFLVDTGHWSDDKRNEFILLSDTLGVSMLVDFLNYGKVEGTTESTVLGPFFIEDAVELPLGSSIAKPGTAGDPCIVTGSVVDRNGKPVADAIIDVWEGDGDGFYDVQTSDEPNLRGRFRSDTDGKFWFQCVRPVSYPVPNDGPVGRMLTATGRHPMRPAHLHTMLTAPGFDRLVTHLFARGDQYLQSDAVFGVKDSLIIDFALASTEDAAKFGIDQPFYRGHYDFILRPAVTVMVQAAE